MPDFTTNNSELTSNRIEAIMAHNEQSQLIVYAATGNAQTYVFVNNKWKDISFLVLMGASLFEPIFDHKSVWVAEDELICRVRYDTTAKKVVKDTTFTIFNSALSSPWITALAKDSSGNLLIGAEGHLTMYHCGNASSDVSNPVKPAQNSLYGEYCAHSSKFTAAVTSKIPTPIQLTIFTLSGRRSIPF